MGDRLFFVNIPTSPLKKSKFFDSTSLLINQPPDKLDTSSISNEISNNSYQLENGLQTNPGKSSFFY